MKTLIGAVGIRRRATTTVKYGALSIGLFALGARVAMADMSGGGVCTPVTGFNPNNCTATTIGKPCVQRGATGHCANKVGGGSGLTYCICQPDGTSDWPDEAKGTARHGSPITPACGQTLSFSIATDLPLSDEFSVPAPYPSGIGSSSTYTGTFSVSAVAVSGQPNICALKFESGTITAPSITLPGGSVTGPNTQILNASLLNGQIDLTTGAYVVDTTGTVSNTLVPEGLPTSNRFTGVVSFGAGTLTFDSVTLIRTPTTVPTLQWWGLAALTMLLGASMVVMFRRRVSQGRITT